MSWYINEMECPNCKSQKAKKWIRPDESAFEGYYYITCATCGLVAHAERAPSPFIITASFINKDIIGETEISWGVFDEFEVKDERIVTGEVERL